MLRSVLCFKDFYDHFFTNIYEYRFTCSRVTEYYTAYKMATATTLFLTGNSILKTRTRWSKSYTHLFKFGDDRINCSKVTDNYLNSRWRLPPSLEKGSSRTDDVDIFRKSIMDFLIAFHVSLVDIYHSFSVKRRNVNEITVFQLPPSTHNII